MYQIHVPQQCNNWVILITARVYIIATDLYVIMLNRLQVIID